MAKKKDRAFSGKTHVMFVLDKSASMFSVWPETIDGFNGWLDEMQKGDADIDFTMVQFDTRYSLVDSTVPIKQVRPLDTERYHPGGNTALYDAIGHCVNVVEPEVGKGDRALVVIMTDGQENSSREHTRASIERMIKDKEDKGNWTFTYLSASLSAFDDALSIGVASGNTATFAATPTGMHTAMRGVASATRAYASAATESTTDFYSGVQTDERDDEPKKPKHDRLAHSKTR